MCETEESLLSSRSIMDKEELGQDEESPPNTDIPLDTILKKQQFKGDEAKSDFMPDQEIESTSSTEIEDGAIALSAAATDLGYSLYICPYFDEMYASSPNKLKKSDLENLINGMKPVGQWIISETSCGLIASFNNQDDMLTVLKQNLSDELKGPVQVAQFSSQDTKYRQSVMIRDVPWAIPLQEVSEALNKQGIHAVSIERARQAIKVEMNDAIQYENLLRSGFDFFGVARFPVVSGRWRFLLANSIYSMDNNMQTQDLPVQCYRCQGFWHIAANCRQLPRCVRCGESHTVEFCPRPRQSPICCHCAGPHHAAYRHCPVRQQLLNSTPVSLSLSTAHRNPNHPKRTNLPT